MEPDTSTTDKTIGARVRAARIDAGIELQGDLVPQLREAGLPWSQGTLSRVESGQRSLKLTEAAILADVLRTTLAALMGTPETDDGATRWETFVGAERLAAVKRTADREYHEAAGRVRQAAAADPAFRERVKAYRERLLATEVSRARRDAARDGDDVSTPELLEAYLGRWGVYEIPAIRASTDVLEGLDDAGEGR